MAGPGAGGLGLGGGAALLQEGGEHGERGGQGGQVPRHRRPPLCDHGQLQGASDRPGHACSQGARLQGGGCQRGPGGRGLQYRPAHNQERGENRDIQGVRREVRREWSNSADLRPRKQGHLSG